MKDVMIDIETLGTRPDAMIIQIGAVYFDRETGETGPGFSANIDSSSFADKFSADYATVKWWFEQEEKARSLVMEHPTDLMEAISSLYDFLNKPDVCLWSHATFDIPILMHAFDVAHIKFPVHYRKMRDIRTLMDLSLPGKSKVERFGVHHNALDDCKYQVAYCVEAMQQIHGEG